MRTGTFTKRYETEARCRAAETHYGWVASLDSGIRLPALVKSRPLELVFEHLGAVHPRVEHLDLVAAGVGQLHAAAFLRTLHTADLSRPHDAGGVLIPDFVTPRQTALGNGAAIDLRLPAAFYKDANLRNFLVVDGEIAVLDFDDLTLAPFGYDLAKLIISAFMTYGRLKEGCIVSMLSAYNQRVGPVAMDAECSLDQLLAYLEIHHLLTKGYIGLHGYRFQWPEVRPVRLTRQTTANS